MELEIVGALPDHLPEDRKRSKRAAFDHAAYGCQASRIRTLAIGKPLGLCNSGERGGRSPQGDGGSVNSVFINS